MTESIANLVKDKFPDSRRWAFSEEDKLEENND